MARWPVHPVPLPDETLSSWVTRLARANAATVSTWFAAIDGKYRDPTWIDYHLEDELAEHLIKGTGLSTGRDGVRQLLLEDLAETLSLQGRNRWMLSCDLRVDRGKHRFCRACFAADATPYLRREWRLEWVHWCRVHDRPLEDRCPACQAVVQPWRTRWDRPFTVCRECGHDLAAATDVPKLRGAPAFVTKAVTEALGVAFAPVPKKAPRETPFEAVWSVQKWAEAVGAASWPAWLELLGERVSQDFDKITDAERSAWSFAIAWRVTRGPEPLLEELVRRHRASFNRATSTHCPPSLEPLRKLIFPRVQLTAQHVSTAIEALLSSGADVNYVSVSDAVGVGAKRISDNEEFRGLIDAAQPRVLERWCGDVRSRLSASQQSLRARGERVSRAQLAAESGVPIDAIVRFENATGESFVEATSSRYTDRVRDAIASLKKQNKRITKRAVASIVGVDRSLFERHQAIGDEVDLAREQRPTAEVLEQACRQLETAGDRVTVVAVARLLGCGKHHIERNEALRDIVEHYQRYERFHREAEVSRAAATLRKAGETITVAALCRVLGKHRSYIEKREWLMEHVSRLGQ